jgi:hypothetical protein
MTEQTFYRWRGKYDGLQISDAKRLRVLEDENRRLKKLVADLSLDNATLEDVVGPKVVATKQRRQVVTHLLAAFPQSSERRVPRDVAQPLAVAVSRRPR